MLLYLGVCRGFCRMLFAFCFALSVFVVLNCLMICRGELRYFPVFVEIN